MQPTPLTPSEAGKSAGIVAARPKGSQQCVLLAAAQRISAAADRTNTEPSQNMHTDVQVHLLCVLQTGRETHSNVRVIMHALQCIAPV